MEALLRHCCGEEEGLTMMSRSQRWTSLALFIVVLVSGIVANERDERIGRIEHNFVLSLCAFLLVAAIAVYGIRRRRGGRAQRRVADPLRSLGVGLAVGLALTAAVLASWLVSYGWPAPGPSTGSRLWHIRQFVDGFAGAPGDFAEKIIARAGSNYVGLGYFDSVAITILNSNWPVPDKKIQIWIEFACLNTLGWFMLLSPAVHLVRWRSAGGHRGSTPSSD